MAKGAARFRSLVAKAKQAAKKGLCYKIDRYYDSVNAVPSMSARNRMTAADERRLDRAHSKAEKKIWSLLGKCRKRQR